MSTNQAAQTRILTNTLRDMVAGSRGSFHRVELLAHVERRQFSGRRVYMLSYGNATRSGFVIGVDVTSRELFIRPAQRATDRPEDSLSPLFTTWAAETLYLDTLMRDALAQGYTLAQWSETPESLAQWREMRSSQAVAA